MDTKRISSARLFAYALPSLTIAGIMGYPLIALVPPLYARQIGIDLSVIGTILFVSKVFDGITDPLVGVLSDRTKTAIGSRKPWMLAGAPLMAIFVYFLFIQQPGAGALYFAVCLLGLYLSWTMIEIPYKAWASELSRDYRERSRITTYLAILGAAGGILFLAAPLLPIVQSEQEGLSGLEVMAWGFIILTIPFMLITVVFVPQGKNIAVTPSKILSDMRSMLANGLFLHFIAAYCVYGAAAGINGAALFFFIDYLDLGSANAAFIGLLIVFCAALIGMPVWLKIIHRLGKHRAWGLAALLNAFIMPWIFLIEPGPGAALPALVCGIFLGLCAGPYNIVPLSILSDIVDYDILKTDVNRAGKYVAIQHLLAKINAAIGVAVAFFILDAFDFKAAGGSDETGIIGLKVVALVLPTVFYLAAAFIVIRFPLNERRHAIIQKRIGQRNSRRVLEPADLSPGTTVGL